MSEGLLEVGVVVKQLVVQLVTLQFDPFAKGLKNDAYFLIVDLLLPLELFLKDLFF